MKSKGVIKSFILFWGLEHFYFRTLDWYSLSFPVQVSIIIATLVIGSVIVLATKWKKQS